MQVNFKPPSEVKPPEQYRERARALHAGGDISTAGGLPGPRDGQRAAGAVLALQADAAAVGHATNAVSQTFAIVSGTAAGTSAAPAAAVA